MASASKTSRAGEPLKLPPPRLEGKTSIEEAIQRRRSVRAFKPRALSSEEIGQLCWSAQGVTEKRHGLRAAPSAGATYPLELYMLAADGVFRYDPLTHTVELQERADLRPALAAAALGQRFVAEAPAVFVISAVYERAGRRYGRRAERYVHIEVGHAAENLHLQAVAMGLASVPVGAFDDAAVSRLLRLPATAAALYIIPIGPSAE